MNAFTQRLATVAAMAARGLRRTKLRPPEQHGEPMFSIEAQVRPVFTPPYVRRIIPASVMSPRAQDGFITESEQRLLDRNR